MIYVGTCYNDEICSLHNGEITDVNIWNKALSLEEIIGWTDCRYIILKENVSKEGFIQFEKMNSYPSKEHFGRGSL